MFMWGGSVPQPSTDVGRLMWWNKDVPDDEEGDEALDKVLPGWRDMPLEDLLEKLDEETEELKELIRMVKEDK